MVHQRRTLESNLSSANTSHITPWIFLSDLLKVIRIQQTIMALSKYPSDSSQRIGLASLAPEDASCQMFWGYMSVGLIVTNWQSNYQPSLSLFASLVLRVEALLINCWGSVRRGKNHQQVILKFGWMALSGRMLLPYQYIAPIYPTPFAFILLQPCHHMFLRRFLNNNQCLVVVVAD